MTDLNLYLKEKVWDKIQCRVKKSHPNSVRMNAYISQKKAEAETEVVKAESKNQTISWQLNAAILREIRFYHG